MAKMNRFLVGLAIGAALGAAAGLLLATKPGKETRKQVSAKAGELRQKATEYAEVLRKKPSGENRLGNGSSDRPAGSVTR